MHHFVDEAGDLSLFNRRGRVVVGSEGVSNYFMVGLAYVPDPVSLETSLVALRADLLADPLLNSVPSLDVRRRKTALTFHAKDDIAEVRHQVFRRLSAFDIEVFVAIRTKHVLVEQARTLIRYGRRISENEIYHDLMSRLLRNRLHLAECNEVIVARRGTRERKEALTSAIARAQRNFQRKYGEISYGPCEIPTAQPSQSAGLQAVDYFLWALQRFYERREDRFFGALARHFKLIMDLDDTRRKPYGEWYDDSNVLTLEKIKPVTG